MDSPESLSALQARHRKEQRDLVARIIQKKKSASKKTRKGVNDECDRLGLELKERQAQELALLNGEPTSDEGAELAPEQDAKDEEGQTSGAEEAVASLSISSPQPDSSQKQDGPKKKPNRQKARLARRVAEQEAAVAQAAEEAANLPDLREQERTRMREHIGKYKLQEKEIRADGHCLYSAVADQMETSGLGLKPKIQPQINGEESTLPVYKTVRHAAAAFIAQNPDDFVPFMEEPLELYLKKIQDTGEWGGHMELMALAKTYRVNINVLHADGRVDKIECGDDAQEIWLGYYRHNFGLGEHYNSLRKAP